MSLGFSALRIGQGYDVHKLVEGRKLIIGGVDIPHTLGLLGHSDADSVIAAQAPKMAPHRQQMRENLAAAMGIAVDNVGVKATTTEHLGFEGRQEGISATAVALLARCS